MGNIGVKFKIILFYRAIINLQFIKFILVGILNTLFGYIVYSLFIFMNMHYSIASFIATIIGIAFNFKTISVFVFKNNNNKFTLKLRFFSVYLVIYIINLISLSIISNYFNLYISAAILILPLALLSYLLNKKFVYRA